MGLNLKAWHMQNLEYFRSYVNLEGFIEKKLLTYSQLLIFRSVPFDVKIYILQDLRFRLEVREVILYLLLLRFDKNLKPKVK